MTAADLLARLRGAGLTVTPDMPARGDLLITPAGVISGELRQLVISHKKALLAHLRAAADNQAAGERFGQGAPDAEAAADQARDDHMAEMKAAAGPGPDPEPFAFGANNPADPDGEAQVLLDEIRAIHGGGIKIDPADRTKLKVTPSPPAEVVARIKRLKPALLELLEQEAREEELSSKPTPFRAPGVGQGGVVPGGEGSVSNGVDGPPDEPPPRCDAPGSPHQAGDEAVGGGQGGTSRGAEANASSGTGQPAEPLRAHVGWVRLDGPGEPWQAVASAAGYWPCWDATLRHPVFDASCERVVLEEGRPPGR